MRAHYKGIEIPDNDDGRSASVRSYDILDSSPELLYDDITELAATICGCPVAYIGFFDEKRQWLKAKYGLPANLTERPRELTLCAPTICQPDLIVVPDLSQNEHYADLPSVKGPPNARFYCGMPLINSEGHALGTLCVVDFEPRELAAEQRESIRRLSRQVMAHLEMRRKLIELDEAHRHLEAARAEIEQEKERSEELLNNILPAKIAEELKQRSSVEPRYYASASILFTDFQGFTRFAERLEPKALVEQLNDFFTLFDEIAERHGLETLKTIGDAYMCVGGLPTETRSHDIHACLAALEMRDAVARINRNRGKIGLDPWEIRIGLHSGPVMAGVIGRRRWSYDIWGDAVNVAASMERHSEAGRINVSQSTGDSVAKFFDLERRGMIEIKNKGQVGMCFLNGINREYSKDNDGLLPNEALREILGR